MTSPDPAAALRRASRDRRLPASLRRALASADEDGVRMAALLSARLRVRAADPRLPRRPRRGSNATPRASPPPSAATTKRSAPRRSSRRRRQRSSSAGGDRWLKRPPGGRSRRQRLPLSRRRRGAAWIGPCMPAARHAPCPRDDGAAEGARVRAREPRPHPGEPRGAAPLSHGERRSPARRGPPPTTCSRARGRPRDAGGRRFGACGTPAQGRRISPRGLSCAVEPVGGPSPCRPRRSSPPQSVAPAVLIRHLVAIVAGARRRRL